MREAERPVVVVVEVWTVWADLRSGVVPVAAADAGVAAAGSAAAGEAAEEREARAAAATIGVEQSSPSIDPAHHGRRRGCLSSGGGSAGASGWDSSCRRRPAVVALGR